MIWGNCPLNPSIFPTAAQPFGKSTRICTPSSNLISILQRHNAAVKPWDWDYFVFFLYGSAMKAMSFQNLIGFLYVSTLRTTIHTSTVLFLHHSQSADFQPFVNPPLHIRPVCYQDSVPSPPHLSPLRPSPPYYLSSVCVCICVQAVKETYRRPTLRGADGGHRRRDPVHRLRHRWSPAAGHGARQARLETAEHDATHRSQLPRHHQSRGMQDRHHARLHPQERQNR
eukprot:GHVU01189808.1.p1 GENE.GHVU01189808.1~~GHVU01189808.1.p1  ORF type:complete len:227 (+),score=2.29 GHVU01189808.1:373-1053(+)